MAAIWVVAAWMFLHSNTILKTDMITFCFFNIFLFRSLFRTQSNIYHGAFLWKQLTLKKCWKNTTNKSWPHSFSFLRDLNIDLFFWLSFIYIYSPIFCKCSFIKYIFAFATFYVVIFSWCNFLHMWWSFHSFRYRYFKYVCWEWSY